MSGSSSVGGSGAGAGGTSGDVGAGAGATDAAATAGDIDGRRGFRRAIRSRTTARLSVADATMTVDPGTLAPSDGEDTVTAGGVTSRTMTVTVSVPMLPSASRTVRVTMYVPGVAKTYDAVAPWSVCIVPSMNVHV